jgi:phosphatidylinositol 3-kinase
MRQDQLVMKVLRLYIQLLLSCVGLDLCLLPYEVLAFSKTEGVLEFVPDSYTLKKVLMEYGSVRQFLAISGRSEHPSLPVMERYVKSCAGYCVLTYVLGIGDRHLENLMLRPDGKVCKLCLAMCCGQVVIITLTDAIYSPLHDLHVSSSFI